MPHRHLPTVLVIVLLLCQGVHAQQSEPQLVSYTLQAELARKAKIQKVMGVVLLSTGVACLGASVPFFVRSYNDAGFYDIGHALNLTIGSSLAGGGVLISIPSIPLLRASRRARRRLNGQPQ